MTHRNMSRRNVQYHLRDEKRIETGRAVALGKIGHFFLEGDQTTNATGKHNTNPVHIYITGVNSCIQYCLVAGNNGCLSKPVQLTGFLSVKKISWIKVFYLAGKPCFKLGRIKIGYEITTTNSIP